MAYNIDAMRTPLAQPKDEEDNILPPSDHLTVNLQHPDEYYTHAKFKNSQRSKEKEMMLRSYSSPDFSIVAKIAEWEQLKSKKKSTKFKSTKLDKNGDHSFRSHYQYELLGDKNNNNNNSSSSNSSNSDLTNSSNNLQATNSFNDSLKNYYKYYFNSDINISYETFKNLPNHIRYHAIKDFLKADIPLTENSFSLCPHNHHCVQNAVFKGLIRTFGAAYAFKTTVALVTNLFTGSLFKRGKLQEIYWSQDAIQFAQFVGIMSFTYKGLLCLLRRYFKRDPVYHKTIAGFIAAFAIILDDQSRHKILALYCIVRAMGDLIKLSAKKKKIPTIKNFDVYAFTAAQMVIMFSFVHNRRSIDKKYYKWICNMGNLTDKTIQQVFRSPSDPSLMYRRPDEAFVPCEPLYHSGSCNKFHMLDWFAGILRAARIYIPVHFLPMLLFTPKLVFKAPLLYLYRKGLNTIRSSLFLTTYQFNMKMVICTVRNLLKDDPWWIGVLGGFFAGLSILIEHPRRRIELLLYVMPRALEILMKLVPHDKSHKITYFIWKLLRLKITPIITFQIAIAIWMTLMSTRGGIKSANHLNMTVLSVIFGSAKAH